MVSKQSAYSDSATPHFGLQKNLWQLSGIKEQGTRAGWNHRTVSHLLFTMSLSTNLQSPARPGAGSLQTLAVPHHSTPEFRSSFKGDLKEAVLYENNHVSKKLLGSADEDLERESGEKIASAILEAIKADKDCVDALKTIETLATQKEDEEVKMYAPLVCLLVV